MRPLDGRKVVETIKDTQMYEKPDAVHGYHKDDLAKDYHAIRRSFKQRKKADEEFMEAYKEVSKEVHDDKPEHRIEFEKFAKSYNGYDKSENEYKLDTYDPPKKYDQKHEKNEKRVKYKETRYQPPTLKPNKYGEIKDVPPPKKYKKPQKYEPTKYETPIYELSKYDRDAHDAASHEGYDVPKYEISESFDPLKYEDPKFGSRKYESLPFERSKKVHKTVDDSDREFDKFFNSNSHVKTKIKSTTYSDDSFGEYSVGHVEKSSNDEKISKITKKPYSAPLKEEIHGSHYFQQISNKR